MRERVRARELRLDLVKRIKSDGIYIFSKRKEGEGGGREFC